MRRSMLGLVILLGGSSFVSEAQAQAPFTSVNDPFFTYYAFYLPREQALANRAGPEATLNTVTANRQAYAATGRNDMFDTTLQGRDRFDSSDDFNFSGGTRRKPSSVAGRHGVHGGNLNGQGAAGYFNTGNSIHFKDLRRGQGRNANLAVTRSRGISSGGYGSIGLPGPR